MEAFGIKSAVWLTFAALFWNSMLPARTPLAVYHAGKATKKIFLAADIKPAALWDGRKSVDFHAIDFPKMVPAAHAGFLAEDEYVLGLTVNGESRAYPTRFAAWHHIINDKIGKKDRGGEAFITVTY